MILITNLFCFSIHAQEEKDYRGSILKEKSNPKVIAKYRQQARERIVCSEFSEGETEQKYHELIKQKWNRAAMWCGLVYGANWADDQWWNPVTQLTVLGGHLEYFEVLNKDHSILIDSIETRSDLFVRWQLAKEQSAKILARTQYWQWLIPEAELLDLIYQLSSTQRYTPSEQVNAVVDLALEKLPKFIEDEEAILDGLALEVYGSILLSLPEFSGGDVFLGIEQLEKSLSINPNQLSVYSSLAEAYFGERENDKVRALLQKASQIKVTQVHPQDYADQLKALSGFAKRLKDSQLENTFSENRHTVLKQKPYLLTREAKAAFGHGGENPITGEKQ